MFWWIIVSVGLLKLKRLLHFQLQKFFWIIVIIKFIFTIIYFRYYLKDFIHSDIWYHFSESRELLLCLIDNPIDFFNLFFGKYNGDVWWLQNIKGQGFQLFFATLLIPITFISGQNFWLSTFLFTILTIFSSVLLLNSLVHKNEKFLLPAFFCIVIIPDMAFFCVGITKESLLLILISFYFICFINKKPVYFLLFILIIIAAFRIFYIPVLINCSLFLYWYSKPRYYIYFVLVVFSCFVLSIILFDYTPLLIKFTYGHHWNTAGYLRGNGTGFMMVKKNINANWFNYLYYFPKTLQQFLLEPLFIRQKSLIPFAFTTFIMNLLLFAWFHKMISENKIKWGTVVLVISNVLFLSFLIASSCPNIATMIRYRSFFMAFLLFLLIYELNWFKNPIFTKKIK